MPILHLGVIEQPYQNQSLAPAPFRSGRRPNRRARLRRFPKTRSVTTGQVAVWLENKYHLMEHWWEKHQDEAAAKVTASLKNTVEAFFMGAPSTLAPFDAATSWIEDSFKNALTTREFDSLGFPGIPTLASLQGKSSRFKRGRGPARPSFIDTGLYQASFKSWID